MTTAHHVFSLRIHKSSPNVIRCRGALAYLKVELGRVVVGDVETSHLQVHLRLPRRVHGIGNEVEG
jgi:hypothetical protein